MLHSLTVSKAISARRIEKIYVSGAERVHALKGVSLDIAKGELLMLIGPSGSGKTTLLSILGGILTATAGSVRVFGREITTLSRAALAAFRRTNIGFLFQSYNLFPALSARENVEIALYLRGLRGQEARRQAMALLDRVGLGGKTHRRPGDLSGGEQQRVAVARALAGDPALVMADEPTASLDAENGRIVVELLRRLARETGSTVLIAAHDPRIRDVADRIAHLDDGLLKPAEAAPL